jgi:hypothetical protein
MFDASDLENVTAWLAYGFANAKTTFLQGCEEEGGVYSKHGRCCQVLYRALRPARRTVQFTDVRHEPVVSVEKMKMVWK